MEIPPASKVSPLPTITFGFSSPPFMYSSTINFGGSSVPWATPASPPIPISVNSSRSKTVRFIPPSSAISFAASARREGVVTFPGWFPRSLARQTALEMAAPFVMSSLVHPKTVADLSSKLFFPFVL